MMGDCRCRRQTCTDPELQEQRDSQDPRDHRTLTEFEVVVWTGCQGPKSSPVAVKVNRSHEDTELINSLNRF